jgi:formate/nitrite transporter FocA (FNT family)
MDAATLPITFFVVVSLVVSVLAHTFIRRVFLASFIAGVVSSILFQIGAFTHEGQLDSFWLVALVFGAAYAWALAMIVGLFFYFVRKQKSGH